MKYLVTKRCNYFVNADTTEIVDQLSKTKITLSGIMKDIFNKLVVKKCDSYDLVQDLTKNTTKQAAQDLVNQLVYALLDKSFIRCKNQILLGGHKYNVHSCLLEITDVCNFRCKHCYVDKTTFRTLPYEKIISIAKDLKNVNCNMITLTGGEIFLHPEFIDIYNYLYDEGFIISLNTNGSLITPKILKLLTLKKPYKLEISLYGHDPKTYEGFTKNGEAFDAVIENIKLLRKNNITTILKSVITNTNKDHFNQIKEIADDLGCRFRSDYIAFPQINSGLSTNPEQISIDNIINHLKTFSNADAHFIKLFNGGVNKYKYNLFKCKRNDDTIFIDSKMNASMCLCMQDFSIKYNLGKLTNSILELRKLKSLKLPASSQCLNCNKISLCRYCPGKFFMSTKSLYKHPSMFCELGEAIYDNFISGYHFIKKNFLSDVDAMKNFDIIKHNMIDLGYQVCDDDQKKWCESLKEQSKRDSFYFYEVYRDGKLIGFVELVLQKDGTLCLSEIQLVEEAKNSRAILEIIKFIVNCADFKNYGELYFNISKRNNKSNATFRHLGGKIVEERPGSYKYVIKRETVKDYLKKFNKKLG